MIDCYVCGHRTATRMVVCLDADGAEVLRMQCCEDCEPKHIPTGSVAVIRSVPLPNPYQLHPADQPHDVPDGLTTVDGREVAHGLLLAVLSQHHGGSAPIQIAGLAQTMGDAAGRLYSVVMEPIDGDPTRVRLVIVKVTHDDDGTAH